MNITQSTEASARQVLELLADPVVLNELEKFFPNEWKAASGVDKEREYYECKIEEAEEKLEALNDAAGNVLDAWKEIELSDDSETREAFEECIAELKILTK